jgi:glycosyltransferase involved in cell wall biosynthesis
MPTVFVSDAILQERLVIRPGGSGPARDRDRDQDQDQDPGGWKALSALYQASLAACGYRVVPIIRPEIYQTDHARAVLGVAPGDWHLAVKPIEHLRPFHGIPNVFVCDWPFAELSAAPRGYSPFFDQARLLGMADAVLCCTAATTQTLRAAGIERAVTLPPHIPPPPPVPPPGTGGRFLCMVEADHLARQLGPMIAGFALAARTHGDISLVIGVQGAGAEILADLRQRVAQAGAGLDERIAVFGADGATAVAGLRAGADFLLCAAAVAGLHLPLAEAMLAGLPLVTTMTPGIASFLPQVAAVPIPTGRGTLDPEDEPIARFLPLTTHPPTAETIRDAVLAAVALDAAARSRMAAAAQAAAAHFGLAAFRAGLGALGVIPVPRAP